MGQDDSYKAPASVPTLLELSRTSNSVEKQFEGKSCFGTFSDETLAIIRRHGVGEVPA